MVANISHMYQCGIKTPERSQQHAIYKGVGLDNFRLWKS